MQLRSILNSKLILLLLLLFMPPAFCASGTVSNSAELPSRGQVQKSLDLLNKQDNLSESEKLTQQDLIKTLSLLDQIDQVKAKQVNLQKELADAPNKTAQAIAGLLSIKQNVADQQGDTTSADKEVKAENTLATLSIDQLESRLNSAMTAFQRAQSDLSAYSSQLINLQTQPERIQETMYAASQQSQELRGQLNATTTTSLRDTERQRLQTRLELLTLQLEYQRNQLAANTTLQDTLQKERDYTTAYINQQDHLIRALQEELNHKRLSLSEQSLKETQQEDADIAHTPLLEQAATTNNALSQQLLTSVERSNTLNQKNIQVKNWLDRVQQSERNLKEQIAVLRGTILLSRILYQQQQVLPGSLSIADLSNRIADLRLQQFEVNQQRDALFQGTTYLQQLGLKSAEPIDAELNNKLAEQVDIRRDLLDRLNKQFGEELSLTINLQINQQQLQNVNNSLQSTLKQQIFWVNSNKPMDLAWLRRLPNRMADELKEISETVVSIKNSISLSLNTLWIVIPLLLIISICRWWYKKIDNTLQRLAREIGILQRDSQWHTPVAILLSLLKTVRGVLIILLIGWCFSRLDVSHNEFYWVFAQRLAMGWMIMFLQYNLLLPGGVAQTHFQISDYDARYYRRQITRIFLAMLPLIFWSAFGGHYPLLLADDVLGQLVVLFTLLLLATLLLPMLWRVWSEWEKHPVRLVMIALITLMPLALIGLMLAGYFYTTLVLAHHWNNSLYLLIVWHITYYTAVRGLAVAARRLAYRRAQARRKVVPKEDLEGIELVEEAPLALEQINQQTLRLVTMSLFMVFICLLYFIWSDVVQVFSYLDSVSLWHYNGLDSAGRVVETVTLGSLLVAALVAVIAYVMTHNLPGLLEVLVLSRLRLRQGTAYAFNTVLTYLISAIGLVSVLSILGVSWEKLQWLVAALSVGLGFGLQEIFANFVSGLIILFERPIRIGDTITIGNFTGSVSRIRIRATTIVDFDYKEVIVPNKAFVTEQLINWTLSDTITRIVIRVGVAYGSDLALVKKVLYQAAIENPRVMRDPEPQVFFLNFGASTLDHELRLYVHELRDRSYTIDEVNCRIGQLCAENNINIAFNQLEVYLHRPQGEQVKVAPQSGEGRGLAV